MTAAVARKYPVPIQVIVWKSVWNALAISGSTTLTIVLSRMAISRPSAITSVACHLYERCIAHLLSLLGLRLWEIDHHPMDDKGNNVLPCSWERCGGE